MQGQANVNPIRVLIAEDHALVLAGVHALVDRLAGVEVIGDARDGREALAMIAERRPDVVLLDITLPMLSGLQVLARVTAEYPGVRVVMLSMHDNEEYVGQALRSGAAGYLLKDSSPVELEVAIRSVSQGGSYLSPFVSRHVVADFVRRGAHETSALDRLSPRQREIVQLIAESRTNQEIANLLGVSLKTVETHRAQLMAKLEIHDLAGLVRFAVRAGLIPADR